MGFLTFRALQLIWASWPFGRAAMVFNYPIHPPVCLKLSCTPFCMVEIIQHALLYGCNYPAHPPVWLNLPNTPSCTIEIILHALKGQKLLAQGNALGINDIQLTPCKGKSFTYRRGFSFFFIRCILKLLPLQGALLIAIIPRAMPWAKSFCPFRACCCGFCPLPLLYPSASDFQFRYAPVTVGSGRDALTSPKLFRPV